MRQGTRHEYFMGITNAVAQYSACLSRRVGCVLVDSNKHILSTGYNGVVRGIPHCTKCERTRPGRDLYACNAVHAEQNALLQCPDLNKIVTRYVSVNPCNICMRLLANTSCQTIVFNEPYTDGSLKQFIDFWGRDLRRHWINLYRELK